MDAHVIEPSESDDGVTFAVPVSSKNGFQCGHCLKMLKDLNSLKAHQLTHSDARPFRCTYNDCSDAFKTKGSLKRHLRRHTGDRPFSCHLCHRAFRESGALTRHLKSIVPCADRKDSDYPMYGRRKAIGGRFFTEKAFGVIQTVSTADNADDVTGNKKQHETNTPHMSITNRPENIKTIRIVVAPRDAKKSTKASAHYATSVHNEKFARCTSDLEDAQHDDNAPVASAETEGDVVRSSVHSLSNGIPPRIVLLNRFPPTPIGEQRENHALTRNNTQNSPHTVTSTQTMHGTESFKSAQEIKNARPSYSPQASRTSSSTKEKTLNIQRVKIIKVAAKPHRVQLNSLNTDAKRRTDNASTDEQQLVSVSGGDVTINSPAIATCNGVDNVKPVVSEIDPENRVVTDTSSEDTNIVTAHMDREAVVNSTESKALTIDLGSKSRQGKPQSHKAEDNDTGMRSNHLKSSVPSQPKTVHDTSLENESTGSSFKALVGSPGQRVFKIIKVAKLPQIVQPLSADIKCTVEPASNRLNDASALPVILQPLDARQAVPTSCVTEMSVQRPAVAVQPSAVADQPSAVAVQPLVVAVQSTAVAVEPSIVAAQPSAVEVATDDTALQMDTVCESLNPFCEEVDLKCEQVEVKCEKEEVNCEQVEVKCEQEVNCEEVEVNCEQAEFECEQLGTFDHVCDEDVDSLRDRVNTLCDQVSSSQCESLSTLTDDEHHQTTVINDVAKTVDYSAIEDTCDAEQIACSGIELTEELVSESIQDDSAVHVDVNGQDKEILEPSHVVITQEEVVTSATEDITSPLVAVANDNDEQIYQTFDSAVVAADDVTMTSQEAHDFYDSFPDTCQACGVKFAAVEMLKTHLKTHLRRAGYKCPVVDCRCVVYNVKELSLHLEVVHMIKESKEALVAEEDSHCNFDVDPRIANIALKQLLEIHGDLETEVQTQDTRLVRVLYGCPVCARAFSLSYLKLHMRSHTGERPYQCELCRKSFRTSDTLTKHMVSHSEERTFKCGECHKTFKRISHAREHLKVHSNRRQYKCTVCDKSFKSANSCKVHMRTHENTLQYTCDICHRAFREKGAVIRHRRTHTGEKPFKCKRCGRGFAEHGTLNRHMKAKVPCTYTLTFKGEQTQRMRHTEIVPEIA